MNARGYRWAIFVLAGTACATIAGFASGSLLLAALVFAVIVSAAFLIESA